MHGMCYKTKAAQRMLMRLCQIADLVNCGKQISLTELQVELDKSFSMEKVFIQKKQFL